MRVRQDDLARLDEPLPAEPAAPAGRRRQHKATSADLDLTGPVDLIVLSVKERAARCRIPGTGRVVTLRAGRLWDVVPGEILSLTPHKQWSYAGHPYLSGEIVSARLDAAALGLVPLRLVPQGTWDPAQEYWGEDGDPVEAWARPIVARGPRPMFEMEQALPGADPENFDTDPIIESNDAKEAGDVLGAHRILMDLCQADLRCLDAHAHLGNLKFEHRPAEAIRHYAVGVRIAELTLGRDFDGVLSWGLIDNRPFLRCLYGHGLCLWRLERFEEAGRVFERMLWLNPSDNQGARLVIDAVRAGEPWTQDGAR